MVKKPRVCNILQLSLHFSTIIPERILARTGCCLCSLQPIPKLHSALWPELSLQRSMIWWFILLEGCSIFAGVFSSPRKVMLPLPQRGPFCFHPDTLPLFSKGRELLRMKSIPWWVLKDTVGHGCRSLPSGSEREITLWDKTGPKPGNWFPGVRHYE